ncbi:MAG: hypothetical protein ACR2N9_11605 [Acidimicrobiia bacterium]
MRIEQQHLIHDVISHESDDVVSLYLPVDPRDPRNQRAAGEEWWRSEAKAMIAGLDVGEAREERLGFRRLLENLGEFADSYKPDERSLVVFATEDDVSTIPLQVAVPSQAALGQPLVTPLIEAVTAYRHYLVVLIAADEIRAVEAHLGELSERGSLRLGRNWGLGNATRSGHRFRFEAHREGYQRSYHRSIAAEIDRGILNGEFDRVILGGSEREANGVLSAMNAVAAQQVAGIAPIPLDASDADIIDRAAPLAEEFEDAAEEAAVRRVLRLWQGSGRGVVGMSSTRKMLSMQLVRRLVLAADAVDEEAREAMIREAYAAGGSVLFVFGPARELLLDHDGIGAELYYNPF